MEDHAEVIKHQMAQTRESLSEKLEALENKVVNTVADTTETVTSKVESIADAVQGTAENVQDAVHRTVESVQGTVHETVATVKDSLDVCQHVERHPWAMLAGSVAAGFVLGRLLTPPARDLSPMTHAGYHPADRPWSEPQHFQAAPAPAPQAHDQGSGQKPEGFLDHMTEKLQPAFDELKDMAIGAATNLVGEMILSSVGPAMRGQVKSVIDQFATALAGKPVRVSEEAVASASQQSQQPASGGSSGFQPHNRLSSLKGNGRSG